MKGDPTAFYAAASALFPILLIAGVIEHQRFHQRLSVNNTRSTALRFFFGCLCFYGMAAIGEFAALRALARGSNAYSQNSVEAPLVAVSGLLLMWLTYPLLVTLEEKGIHNALTRGLNAFSVVIVLALALVLLL